MLCWERPRTALCLALLLGLLWSVRLVGLHDVSLSGVLSGSPATGGQEYVDINNDADATFVREAAAVEFPSPFDARPLQGACARSARQPGLLFTCEEQHGGIGMVRNQLLKCIRYAMHAGASALVVPTLQRRSAVDLADIETQVEVPLDYLLDRAEFASRLAQGCPGLSVLDRADQLPGYNRLAAPPLDLTGDQFDPDRPSHPAIWRSSFDAWLREKTNGTGPTRRRPVHVRTRPSFMEYPVDWDGAAFSVEFGKLLSFRADARDLAARVLLSLDRRFKLAVDPSRAVQRAAYYGAHLRLEDDAVRAWPAEAGWRFSRMDDQFEEHFTHIARTGLAVVYVASGNASVVDEFSTRLRARHRRVAVVSKHDLLGGKDRGRLNAMTFDQQALVDFLVLFKASAFMGVAHSSFPWTVALRRHEMSRYDGLTNEGSDILRDEFSVLMGRQADYAHMDPFATGIWP